MTGPDHYRAAEHLLAKAVSVTVLEVRLSLTEMAQVHATLALTAATLSAADTRWAEVLA